MLSVATTANLEESLCLFSEAVIPFPHSGPRQSIFYILGGETAAAMTKLVSGYSLVGDSSWVSIRGLGRQTVGGEEGCSPGMS